MPKRPSVRCGRRGRELVAARVLDAFAGEVARAHERVHRQQMQLALPQQLPRDGFRRARAVVEPSHARAPW